MTTDDAEATARRVEGLLAELRGGPDPRAAVVAEELTRWCRAELSGVKTPRQIDFTAELPRHATGKLYKRLLRDRYWPAR